MPLSSSYPTPTLTPIYVWWSSSLSLWWRGCTWVVSTPFPPSAQPSYWVRGGLLRYLHRRARFRDMTFFLDLYHAFVFLFELMHALLFCIRSTSICSIYKFLVPHYYRFGASLIFGAHLSTFFCASSDVLIFYASLSMGFDWLSFGFDSIDLCVFCASVSMLFHWVKFDLF